MTHKRMDRPGARPGDVLCDRFIIKSEKKKSESDGRLHRRDRERDRSKEEGKSSRNEQSAQRSGRCMGKCGRAECLFHPVCN